MIVVGQIFTPKGSLLAARGRLRGSSASYYAPKLSVYTVENAAQGCGRARLVKINVSNSLSGCSGSRRSQLISAIMSSVTLLGRGWNFDISVLFIYTLHMWVITLETT